MSFKTFLQTASLTAASSIFALGMAIAAPAPVGTFSDQVNTSPKKQSGAQAISRGQLESSEDFSDVVDRDAVMQSRHQRISHKIGDTEVFSDKVELTSPMPRAMMYR